MESFNRLFLCLLGFVKVSLMWKKRDTLKIVLKCHVPSLVIWGMKIKTPVKYALYLLGCLKKQIISVGEDVEKLGPSYTLGGNVKRCRHLTNSLAGPQNVKDRIATSRLFTPERNEHVCSLKNTMLSS